MSAPQVTFVDAASLVRVLDRTEQGHRTAAAMWQLEIDAGATLVTTNYSVLKASLELHRRHGSAALATLVNIILPAMHVEWCTRADHDTAVAALLAADHPRLDLVDRVDEQIRRRLRIDAVLDSG